MALLTLADALNTALKQSLQNDKNVVLFGEDVGKNGGVFRITQGLQEQFGTDRVMDTPLAENMLAGMAIGMATQGLKPIVEFQFMGFIYPGFDQILSHASRMRNRTRGRLSCPIVYRAPYGGGIHAPEHHSESTEALFAHIPGLRVVIPSTPAQGYGLMLAAIENPDPIIFLEPKRVYRLHKQEIDTNGQALPLDRCFIMQTGNDVTLISWGAMIQETLDAAKQLQQQGLSAEVIDLATIKPIDINTIIDSVEKTGRVVIIHEAARFGGIGAELCAQINEYAFESLQAPIQRVTGYDTIMPYPKLEHYYMPSTKRIIQAVQKIMEYQ